MPRCRNLAPSGAGFSWARGRDASISGVLGGVRQTRSVTTEQLALTPPTPSPNGPPSTTSSAASTANAGQSDTALTQFQKSINYADAAGNQHSAGWTRYNIAHLLGRAGRHTDALVYARAALADYTSYGPAAAADA
jgi:hypothetical protein